MAICLHPDCCRLHRPDPAVLCLTPPALLNSPFREKHKKLEAPMHGGFECPIFSPLFRLQKTAGVHTSRASSGLYLRSHLWRSHGICWIARGLAVAASIPIAVLSISILRAFGRASILENNIVQTTGNAGQSIASGVIFTLPALVFLGFDLEYSRIFILALIGGWLGVLFMIPLRRQLIVKEHGACRTRKALPARMCSSPAKKAVRWPAASSSDSASAASIPFCQNENLLSVWPVSPYYQPDFGTQHVLKGASIDADATSEYLGVGYIIGSRWRESSSPVESFPGWW